MKEGGTKTKGRITATTTAQQAAPRLKAGPSVSDPSAANIKSEEKDNETVKEESKKPKQTGKLNFFAPKAQAQPKDKEKVSSKSVTEGKNKMFFGAATKSAASSAKESPPAAPPPPPKEEKPKEADSVKVGFLTCILRVFFTERLRSGYFVTARYEKKTHSRGAVG